MGSLLLASSHRSWSRAQQFFRADNAKLYIIQFSKDCAVLATFASSPRWSAQCFCAFRKWSCGTRAFNLALPLLGRSRDSDSLIAIFYFTKLYSGFKMPFDLILAAMPALKK